MRERLFTVVLDRARQQARETEGMTPAEFDQALASRGASYGPYRSAAYDVANEDHPDIDITKTLGEAFETLADRHLRADVFREYLSPELNRFITDVKRRNGS